MVLLALALTAVGSYQYVSERNFLFAQLASRLLDQAVPALQPGRVGLRDADSVTRAAAGPFVAAAIFDTAGNQVAFAPALSGAGPRFVRPLLQGTVLNPRRQSPDYQVLRDPGGDVLAIVIAVPSTAGPAFLVMETALAPTYSVLDNDLLTFIVASLIALLVGALLGYALTGAMLRRLGRLSDAAGAIAAGDLGRRANLGGGDEVSAVGSAFDDMVGRLQVEIVRQQEAEAYMRRFLGDASHELRTPLTALRGNLDILMRGAIAMPADLRGSITDMHITARRMTRLVNQLLALSRLEDGGPDLQVADLALRPLLAEAARTARLAAGNHRLVVTAAPGLLVRADPDALHRVLLNLLDNAAKYSPEGSRIDLRARSAADGAGLAIRVEDRGEGVAEEDRARIFERFYRADKARRAGGLGLGLAISSVLVQRLGGRISVAQREGGGSVFTVTLPRPEPEAAPPIVAAPTEAAVRPL